VYKLGPPMRFSHQSSYVLVPSGKRCVKAFFDFFTAFFVKNDVFRVDWGTGKVFGNVFWGLRVLSLAFKNLGSLRSELVG
jgi:hypothetical protein